MSKFGIISRDILYEFHNGGLRALIEKIYSYVFDPRRKLIDSELAAWHQDLAISRSTETNLTIKVPGFVSVIMPIYDRTWEVECSLASILSQSYENFELILVTDGSPEETMLVVGKYVKDPRIRIFHFLDNSGTAVRGRNVGIVEARGEYIAFQDSDDIAEPGRLAASVKALDESGADILYGGWRAKVEAIRADADVRDGEEFLPYPFSVKDLFRNNRICHSTVMMRRGVFDDIGGYKPQMRFREDHELWLRAAYFGYRFQPIPKVLATLRIHERNNTLNFIEEDMKWYRLMLQEYKTRHHLEPIASRVAGEQ